MSPPRVPPYLALGDLTPTEYLHALDLEGDHFAKMFERVHSIVEHQLRQNDLIALRQRATYCIWKDALTFEVEFSEGGYSTFVFQLHHFMDGPPP